MWFKSFYRRFQWIPEFGKVRFRLYFSYFKKMLETCFFYLVLTFNIRQETSKKRHFIPISSNKWGCYHHPSTLCRRACMDSGKKKFLKILILETCKMPRTGILRIRNCFHINVIYFYLELMSKSVSLKILGLKLGKMDCIVL